MPHYQLLKGFSGRGGSKTGSVTVTYFLDAPLLDISSNATDVPMAQAQMDPSDGWCVGVRVCVSMRLRSGCFPPD